ncbi:MAG TPA: N-acetylmuramoyl-L-alanine amidase, partial [Candidatus Acidoferrum sp.]|nr:N-acetylmuramoyl-L-alanine amidase [Candidatus Acidoferrum sp.]
MRIIFSLLLAAGSVLFATLGAESAKTAPFWQQSTTQPTQQATQQAPQQTPQPPAVLAPSLNVVVLDPAHGGTDAGARGAGGINESDVVLDFARAIRAALEAKGFRVVQTRSGADNPSFDDRSTAANAQRGAVFITLHVSSTGTPGQVRVYSEPMAGSIQTSA